MELIKFMEQFQTEKKCREHFKELRMQQGIVCKRCKRKNHYWLKGKEQFQCVACKFRTTLRSGTVMEHSNLSFKTWFNAMYLMTSTKKGMSAAEMQRQLGIRRYEPVWALMHKVRIMMGKRESLYWINYKPENDEGDSKLATNSSHKHSANLKYVSIHKNFEEGTESIAIETNVESKKRNQQFKRQCRFFNMKVLDGFSFAKSDRMTKSKTQQNSKPFTDTSRSYSDLEQHIEAQIIKNSSSVRRKTYLKWVHLIIGNARRTLVGIHHIMKKNYLQNYLDEFVYKLNRRYQFKKLFELTLVVAVINLR